MQGAVESVNDKGVKINGTWHNFSKFAEFHILPNPGDKVEIKFDKSGKWITELEILPKVSPTTNRRSLENQQGSPPESSKHEARPEHQLMIDKEDLRNSRIAALNIATEILKTQNKPFSTAQVLEKAEELLRWALNSTSASSVNTSSPLNEESLDIEEEKIASDFVSEDDVPF